VNATSWMSSAMPWARVLGGSSFRPSGSTRRFFGLRTRVAGEIVRKFVNDRVGILVLCDTFRHTEAGSALRLFVRERNRALSLRSVDRLVGGDAMAGTAMTQGASVAGMRERVEPTSASGCLVAAVGASVGFGVWQQGARPALRGSFEGQRDWSLLYVELPFMLLGTPVIALVAWALTSRMLRRRAGRSARTAAAGGVAAVTLAALAWVWLAWLDMRVDAFLQGDA
jgi:hypothetical protein